MTEPTTDDRWRANAERVQVWAGRLAQATRAGRLDALVVLGSGFSDAAGRIGKPAGTAVSPADAGLPAPRVAGHAGRLELRDVDGAAVLVAAGRVHLYEGWRPDEVVATVRAACALGARTVVLTNAAGGIRSDLAVGDLVLLADHVNLTGATPLAGPYRTTPLSFLDCTEVYDPRLRAAAVAADPAVKTGVYAALPGPSYETPAEVRMLQACGADTVGMSTVLEALAAHDAGARVLGCSLVTNRAAGLAGGALDHTEVLDAGQRAGARVAAITLAALAGH